MELPWPLRRGAAEGWAQSRRMGTTTATATTRTAAKPTAAAGASCIATFAAAGSSCIATTAAAGVAATALAAATAATAARRDCSLDPGPGEQLFEEGARRHTGVMQPLKSRPRGGACGRALTAQIAEWQCA